MTMTIQELIDLAGKKFDVCLMNPPYDKNLHLKFLEKTIKTADKVVSIEPCTWLTNPLGVKKKSSAFKKYENSISKHIADLEIITPDNATSLFGGEGNIQIPTELGIFICTEKGGFDYNITEKFPLNLFEEHDFPFKTGTYKGNEDKNFVSLVSFAGCLKRGRPAMGCTNKYGAFINGLNKDGLSFEEAKKSNKAFTLGNIDNQLIAIFDTGKEAENFYNMCQTDFWRFICYNSTKGNSINLKFLPWPDDYKKPWDNERFYKYFNLNDKEIKLVESTMKELYSKYTIKH